MRFVLLDVNGGEDVLLHQLLADEDGVFVVISFPGHKRDQHVSAQSELALVRGGTVGDHFALFHPLPDDDQGLLVEARALIGTGKFKQLIAIFVSLVGLDDDLLGGDVRDHARLPSKDDNPRIDGRLVFHAGADQWGLGPQQGHRLALHVRRP